MSENVQKPGGNIRVLILSTVAFALCFAGWSLYAPLAMYLRTEFNLSSTSIGLLIAIPVLVGSVAKTPLGILTDMYGGRLVYTLVLLFGFVSLIFTSFANSYGSFLACGFIFGLVGASFSVGIAHVSEWYPKEKQGFALGVYTAGNAGIALAAFGVPLIAEAFGWNKVFIIYAIPLLIMAVIYWFFTSDAPKPANAEKPSLRKKIKIYKSAGLAWIFCLFYFVTFGLFVCFAEWLPSYINDFYNISHVKAGSFAAIFVFITSFSRILGGYLGDKFDGRRILIALTVVILCINVFLILNISLAVALAAFYMMGICLGAGSGVIYKLVPEYFPKDAGAIGGLVGTAGGLGGFFLPIIMGTIKDYTDTYYLGFIFVALVCLMSLSFMEEKTLKASPKRAMGTA
ncbi:MAG: MFS transporter [Candidatus Loosdrechtia sp.]|uniref:MFS transporter n=1 Tax=Candidatus Loosdrechtia sp. TaxID=3101272 RepID=UPI003A6ECFDA|nr:MAG: nitrate/nitrite transporter [Candidatus Jettenia sp. AMX2]